jgi:mono/diheme cytochrome c family protein
MRRAFSLMRLVLVGFLAPAFASAQESTIMLSPGVGRDQAQAYCAACHSLDYVVMNSPFLDSAHWDAEIAKMAEAYGAPIPDRETMAAIRDYLSRNYGSDR